MLFQCRLQQEQLRQSLTCKLVRYHITVALFFPVLNEKRTRKKKKKWRQHTHDAHVSFSSSSSSTVIHSCEKETVKLMAHSSGARMYIRVYTITTAWAPAAAARDSYLSNYQFLAALHIHATVPVDFQSITNPSSV